MVVNSTVTCKIPTVIKTIHNRLIPAPEAALNTRLLSDPFGEEASIHRQNMPGDEGRSLRAEKNCRTHQFIDVTVAAHGRAAEDGSGALRNVERLGVQGCAKYAGRDRVHADPRLGPLAGELASNPGYPGFARAVRADLVKADKCRHGTGVDDGAGLLPQHLSSKDLVRAECAVQIGVDDARPLLFRYIGGRAPMEHPGGDHQDVNPPVGGDYLQA